MHHELATEGLDIEAALSSGVDVTKRVKAWHAALLKAGVPVDDIEGADHDAVMERRRALKAHQPVEVETED